jgi:hypothetical protein
LNIERTTKTKNILKERIVTLEPIRRRGYQNMKYREFKRKIKQICRKKREKTPKVPDIIHVYWRYKHTLELISNEKAAQHMLKFIDMSEREQLKYRNTLAEEGVELTPDQVKLYIYMMHIAAEEYLQI